MNELINDSEEELKADGERFLPEKMRGVIELEHRQRYIFAAQLVAGKTVLDIASGEGYGSAYLAERAAHVVGVDISHAAVQHAKTKYRRQNLEYRVGTCANIPVKDKSVDLVVSFETIEHHDEHEAMMSEIKRVLRPGGVLVISSPDKSEYSDKPGFSNPFHIKELYREEFEDLLQANFENVKLYGQRVLVGSMLLRENKVEDLVFHEIGGDSPPAHNLPRVLYWVAVASDRSLPITQGGVLEQSLSDMWRDISIQRNVEVTAIIGAVAKPESKVLRDCLNGEWYLQNNPDLTQSRVDPYSHWMECGMQEGRVPTPDPVGCLRDLLTEREEERWPRETENALADRVAVLYQEFSRERMTQLEAIQLEKGELEKKYAEREAQFRDEIAQLRLAERDLFERHQLLDKELMQSKLDVRDETDGRLGEAQRQKELLVNLYSEREEKLRAEIELHLLALADRERSFTEKLAALQHGFVHELTRQADAARLELESLRAEYRGREEAQRLERQSLAEQLRDAKDGLHELQREFEDKVVQEKFRVRDELDGQLRALAEREREIGVELTKWKRQDSEALEKYFESTRRQFDALESYHTRLEDKLEQEIEAVRAQSKQAEQAFNERRHILEAEIAQIKVQAQAEIDEQLRSAAECERTYTEQLAQVQDSALKERELQAQRDAQVIAELRHQLEAIQRARTWRLTAPLRAISRFISAKATG